MPTFYSPLGPTMSSAKRHPSQTPIVIHNELAGRERTRRELSAQPHAPANPFSTLAAKSRENRGKNRYTDIAPYDRTRVKVGGEEGPEGYLNASWVEEVDGGRRWIAGQVSLSFILCFFSFSLFQQSYYPIYISRCTVPTSPLFQTPTLSFFVPAGTPPEHPFLLLHLPLLSLLLLLLQFLSLPRHPTHQFYRTRHPESRALPPNCCFAAAEVPRGHGSEMVGNGEATGGRV